MSRLIKANAASIAIQPLTQDSSLEAMLASEEHARRGASKNSSSETLDVPAVDLTNDRTEALDRQCLELEATVAQLRSDLADAERDAKQREEAAFQKGLAEGAGLASVDEDKRIAALTAGLDRLVEAQAMPIAECEMLALHLSRAALGRLFGDKTLHAELIEASIGSQMARVGRDLVSHVAVSPLDFTEEALARIAGRFAGVEVATDEKLPPGNCTIRLRLGRLDLSLPRQWRNLCDHFEQLALEGAGT